MSNSNREKAIALINAYFDNKDIVVKDPKAGIEDWISINSNDIWTYLDMFCRNLDKYKIVESKEDKSKSKQDKFDPNTLQPFDKVLVKLGNISMTREEEISKAIDDFLNKEDLTCLSCSAYSFKKGAEWADSNPKSKQIGVEYWMPIPKIEE